MTDGLRIRGMLFRCITSKEIIEECIQACIDGGVFEEGSYFPADRLDDRTRRQDDILRETFYVIGEDGARYKVFRFPEENLPNIEKAYKQKGKDKKDFRHDLKDGWPVTFKSPRSQNGKSRWAYEIRFEDPIS